MAGGGKGIIKGLGLFLFGAAVGGSTAALVTFKMTEKKWQKISDDRVKSMQEYVDELRAKDAAGELLSQLNYSSDQEIGLSDDVPVQNEKKPEREAKVNGNNSGDHRAGAIDYTRFYQGVETPQGSAYEDFLTSRTHPIDEEMTDIDPETDAEDVLSRHNRRIQEMLERNQGDKAKPKIIRASEFDEYEFHDKVTLYYHTEDGVLSTEDGEIVDDVEAYIGDALTKFGYADNDDEEVIYVRNINRGTDYEVAKVFGSYEDDY